jgi:hypothetical protein
MVLHRQDADLGTSLTFREAGVC